MIKAFVFGKFLPFHKGHQALIDFAANECDFLTVLVCCSDTEKTACNTRVAWIEKTYAHKSNIEIMGFNYHESELPNTSTSSKKVSKIWAAVFKQLFPDYSLLVTSETYGNYVASFMGIQHINFDEARSFYPVSATEVRKNIFATWQYLPVSVRQDLAIKIIILGTESTGKTTLTQRLAKHFNCGYVLEAGRDVVATTNDVTLNDLSAIAIEHAQRINEAASKNPLLIVDTDIHITKSYAHFLFDSNLTVAHDIYLANKAHLYLYLNNDVAYVQDGTRLGLAQRDKLDTSHRLILDACNVDFVEIKGNWQERFELAVGHIKKLVASIQENGVCR